MNGNRRDFLKAALLLPAGVHLAKFQALAAPHAGKVKITAIKTLQLDNVGDGCLIRLETDAGLVGYGESGVSALMARARIENIQEALLGQDPLAIGRHFHLMVDQQHPFMGNIPFMSGIDIALWDLAGKILDQPVYQLLGGLMRPAAPVYAHGGPRNYLDLGECRAWAHQRYRHRGNASRIRWSGSSDREHQRNYQADRLAKRRGLFHFGQYRNDDRWYRKHWYQRSGLRVDVYFASWHAYRALHSS